MTDSKPHPSQALSGLGADDAALLTLLQQGLPFEPRPFARLGAAVGLSEDAVLARLRGWFATGLARRFGAVFDARGLGYDSTLCAVAVPEAEVDRAAAPLLPHSGVTHCYVREGTPALWFTLTAPAESLEAEVQALSAALAPYALWNLPAVRRFKVEVIFDPRAAGHDDAGSHPCDGSVTGAARREADAPYSRPARDKNGAATEERMSTRPPPATRPPQASAGAAPLTAHERAIVRRLQGTIAVTPDPFAALAEDLGEPVETFLERLRTWRQRGVLRRIGLIVRHQHLGFAANGMCIWRVPPEEVEAAGRRLAACREVTHCYERRTPPAFPYNLFAMIHAARREDAQASFERLARAAQLSDGRMLVSTRELKKSSPVFFA